MKPASRMITKVDEYLAFRRGFGYQLRTEGRLLQQFAAFADAAKHRGPLTIDLALQWAQLPSGCDRLYCARRLEVVRCFARHLAVTEADTQVPPRGMLGPAHRRTTPHIYTGEELAALMTRAERLSPSGGLRPRMYATLIGFLACTGLRISEALRLTRFDADLNQGIVKVRETKFRKTRLVPVHATAAAALRVYAETRDRLVTEPQCDRFFICGRGQALPYSTVRSVFRRLCDSLQIKGDGRRVGRRRRRPRLHDLRHTFACRRVEECYDAGAELGHSVSALSVYLGHAKVSDTYWYLTATPRLMARAAQRFESFAGRGTGEEVGS
jgi:integrase